MKVALVCMPFASVDRPALGVSTLKARLLETGSQCDVHYFSLAFAQLIGRWSYDRIAEHLPHRMLVGEWVFTGCLFADGRDPGGSYIDEILLGEWKTPQADVDVVRAARAAAPLLMSTAVSSVDWARYDIIGFSSGASQNIASLALARELKARHPSTPIVFGGANWQGVMGAELLRRFPFVDVAFSGDADDAFPAALDALRGGDTTALRAIPSAIIRTGSRVRSPRPPSAVVMDELPMPDHGDFFRQLADSPRARGHSPSIPLETSRGCWWAERHPCGFCGLDAAERVFRTKSPPRILSELRDAAVRWPGGRLFVVDTVVSPAFLGQVLPQLAELPLPLPMYFEVRPDVTREHVKLAGRARADIQPGIESFSDHVLRLMGKGTRALENIRLLKWCKTYGVTPHWNVIYGFPGETREDYEELLELLPAISFLCPPRVCEPLSVDRYSPFHEAPDAHGFRDLGPHAPYRHLYPFSRASLTRISYSFSYRCTRECISPEQEERLHAAVREWQLNYTRRSLRIRDGRGSFGLVDERPGAVAGQISLDPLEQLLYRRADDIATLDALREAGRQAGADATAVDQRLASLVDRRLMASVGGRYLSLALPDPAVR